MAPQDSFPSGPHPDLDTTTSLISGAYALSAEKLNEISKLLRQCGIERVVPPLPKIAVIGNQSAGKSSLIEAISKIKVPRSKGTTTRCPMEVVLRSKGSDGWRCLVQLRFECSSDVPAGRKLETVDFTETQTPEDISLIIRRAQLAILNPTKDPKEFLNLDQAQCEKHPLEFKFSRNLVVLEITNANVDVTFIDLPGIIANTLDVLLTLLTRLTMCQADDDNCIVLIKELALHHARQQQCLILVTVSMEGKSILDTDF